MWSSGAFRVPRDGEPRSHQALVKSITFATMPPCQSLNPPRQINLQQSESAPDSVPYFPRETRIPSPSWDRTRSTRRKAAAAGGAAAAADAATGRAARAKHHSNPMAGGPNPNCSARSRTSTGRRQVSIAHRPMKRRPRNGRSSIVPITHRRRPLRRRRSPHRLNRNRRGGVRPSANPRRSALLAPRRHLRRIFRRRLRWSLRRLATIAASPSVAGGQNASWATRASAGADI